MSYVLPHQTQYSFQHDDKLKIAPEVIEKVAQVDEKGKEEVATQVDEKGKEEVATQVDEKVKEEVATQVDEKGKEDVAPQVDEKVKDPTQTSEEMQRDEGELTVLSYKEKMDEGESECIHTCVL